MPLELAQRIPSKATSFLSKLYSAKKSNLWYLEGLSPGAEQMVLDAFYDALLNFDRPENQLRATQFFLQLDKAAATVTRPFAYFVAALARRVFDSNLLQDLREASDSSSRHVDPSRIPEWFRAAVRTLTALRLGCRDRGQIWSRVVSNANSSPSPPSLTLRLPTIPRVDLVLSRKSIIKRIVRWLKALAIKRLWLL